MKNFTTGLLIGIVATACYFRFLYSSEAGQKPLEKVVAVQTVDTPSVSIKKNVETTADIRPVPANYHDVVNRDSLLAFAKSLLGTTYLYASIDPAKGFDCSGFITYVFNHFNIKVPRSSYEFENFGNKVTLPASQPGDIILFTGTNPQERTIGHIGIITDTSGGYRSFIHSSSGKANGVTITSMESSFYQERFVSVVDIISRQ